MMSDVAMAAAGAASRARRMLWRTKRSPHITCKSADAAPARQNPATSSALDALACAAAMLSSETATSARATAFGARQGPTFDENRSAGRRAADDGRPPTAPASRIELVVLEQAAEGNRG